MSFTKQTFKKLKGTASFSSTRRTSALPRSLLEKKPDDVVVTWVKRTAVTKAKKGGFKDTPSDVLLLRMLQAARQNAGFDTDLVEDIVVGQCHAPSPCYESRAAAIAAGFAEHTPVQAVNRLCASGLMAIRAISDSVARGDIDIGLAAGVESMTFNPRPTPVFKAEEILKTSASKDCAEPMGWTSENVGRDFEVSREKMDRYALRSHTRASEATKSGLFLEEIIPIEVQQVNAETGESVQVKVDTDDGIRHGTTLEALAKAKPAFPQWVGLSTGGNSSQVSDGAAAAFLMKRRTAERLGLKPLAVHVNTAVVGVTPKWMGIGPTEAIPKSLSKAGLSVGDVDLFEVRASLHALIVSLIDF